MKIIAFQDYAIVILNRNFPPIASRRELLQFMNDDSQANIIWTEFINWHCGLNPANRTMTFRAWMNQLTRDQCTYSEWCFIADLKHDDDFPSRGKPGLDVMTEYMLRIGAHDSTLDSLESLWIKYNLAE